MHSFEGRTCDRVVVSMLRRPSNCPLGSGRILVLTEVFAKRFLFVVVVKHLIPFELEFSLSLCVDNLLQSVL